MGTAENQNVEETLQRKEDAQKNPYSQRGFFPRYQWVQSLEIQKDVRYRKRSDKKQSLFVDLPSS